MNTVFLQLVLFHTQVICLPIVSAEVFFSAPFLIFSGHLINSFCVDFLFILELTLLFLDFA